MIRAFTFTLLLGTIAGSPAFAQGFGPEDLKAAARAGQADASTLIVHRNLAATSAMRAAFALDPAKAWASMEESSRTHLMAAFGPYEALSDTRMTWFFRTALAAASPTATGSRTGLYCPAADVWLVLEWRQVGGQPVLTAAALKAGGSGPEPDWTERDGAWGAALASASVAAVTDLEEADPSPSAAERSAAIARMDLWLGSLAALHASPEWNGRWIKLKEALAAQRPTGALASLPAPIRRTLAPMAYMQGAAGGSVLLVSPFYPEMAVTADFGAANTAPQLGVQMLISSRSAETNAANPGASK